MEHLIKMDDLGGKPTIFGNIHAIPQPAYMKKKSLTQKNVSKISRVKPGEGKWISWLRGGILHKQKKMGKNPPSSPVRECFTAPTPNFHTYTQKILQIRLKLTATKAFSWKNSRIFCLEFWRDFFGGSKEPIEIFRLNLVLPWWNFGRNRHKVAWATWAIWQGK